MDIILAQETDYLYTQSSQIPHSGLGLFTAIPIYKEEIIAVFRGKILSLSQAKTIALQGNDRYFINLLNGKILDSMPVDCFAKYANFVVMGKGIGSGMGSIDIVIA
jgi:uncharacterized protein